MRPMKTARSVLIALAGRSRLGALELSFPILAVLSFKKLAPLVDGFKELASTVAKVGLSTPLSSMTLRRRRDLGLPEVRFSAEEARRLLEAAGVLKPTRQE